MKMMKYFRKILRKRITYRKKSDGTVSEGLEYGQDKTILIENFASCSFPKKYIEEGRFGIIDESLTRCFEMLGLSLFIDVRTFIDENGIEKVFISVEKNELN